MLLISRQIIFFIFHFIAGLSCQPSRACKIYSLYLQLVKLFLTSRSLWSSRYTCYFVFCSYCCQGEIGLHKTLGFNRNAVPLGGRGRWNRIGHSKQYWFSTKIEHESNVSSRRKMLYNHRVQDSVCAHGYLVPWLFESVKELSCTTCGHAWEKDFHGTTGTMPSLLG